jgi:alpha-L-fucosidase 2
MNYWPAETGNCSRAVEPLVHFMKMLSRFGKKTARELFGARGWTVNHTTDVFGRTGIHDHADCGFFPMGGPWMCLSLWEHYEYTHNEPFLREIYPILRDACLFLCDYLVAMPDGRLVTTPSNSPENKFYYQEPSGERQISMLTYGATIDFEIIHALFTRTAYACRKLGDDLSLAHQLENTLQKLPPLRVSERYGTICEWIRDYEEVEPGHRHISHLFGLYPSDQISENTSVLYEAAKRTIARRLANNSGGQGWTRAWMVNFYARLRDGEQALFHLHRLLSDCTSDNFFDMHPPFQIDGNFGGSAGVAEMLLQSHLGSFDQRIISILPALPSDWKSGSFKGLCARGNFYLDAQWRDGKVTKVTVHAVNGGDCRIKLTEEMENFQTEAAHSVSGNVLTLATAPGGVYEIQFN